jgi:peptide/nickel transport system ATP-binding protein
VPIPGKVQRDKLLGSIPGVVPTIAPGFEGCAFRSRCSFADATCERDVPRKAASAAHDYLCRLAPRDVAELQPA